MDDDEFIRRQRESMEAMERARQERAMQSYRRSHPLVEKEELNPMEAVIELAEEYFNNNPDANEYQIDKAVLGRKWNVSINPQNRMIAYLCSEHGFITNTKKGFIIIDKTGFYEWHKLEAEIKEKEEAFPRQHIENDALKSKYEELKKTFEHNEVVLQEERNTIRELEKKLEKQDYEDYINEETIFSLKAQIKERKPDSDKIKIERIKLFEESQVLRNKLTSIYESSNWFSRWWKSNPFEYVKALLTEAERVLHETWK